MDISGLNKVDVLTVLVNNAKPNNAINKLFSTSISREKAKEILQNCASLSDYYLDYVCGRPLKVDLSDDILDVSLYNRDNGDGAAEKAISSLRMSS